ncbi:MAG: MarR family transcriptional regulator [Halobacteriales archaeon]|nr:MarR family transcriptional regulator [Halobacteriales archaeon]
MSEADRRELSVLRHKRAATRYRVLVEIAARQPAVSQREIADAIGVTAQAVSEYVGELVELEHVEKEGRGRYRITKEGVDWLLSRTDELQAFTTYVTEEVVGQVDVEAAIATDAVAADEPVALSMRDGVLHATPRAAGRASAVAVTAAEAGEAVGVSEFEGLLDYEPGVVTVVSVPAVAGEAREVAPDLVERADAHDLLAVAGVEALAAVRTAGLEPDVRFGTPQAVEEAAARGLDVLLVAVQSAVSAHTDRLREQNIRYEVLDPGA